VLKTEDAARAATDGTEIPPEAGVTLRSAKAYEIQASA
jgi:hypothetical protein